jgi:hypothetical protein
MNHGIYFGNILAEIAAQHSQGRVQNIEQTECQVYTEKRRHVFSCRAGHGFFEYCLESGENVFTKDTSSRPEILAAGWDGLTHSQQMDFVAELHLFMRKNHMTDSTMGEFVRDLSKPPI